MRRILLHIAVLLLSGMALAGFAPVFPYQVLIAILLLFTLLAGAVSFLYGRRNRPLPTGVLALFFVAAGFLYNHSYLSFHPNQLQPYYEQHVKVMGVVEDTPIFLNGKWQYTIRVESLTSGSDREVILRDRIRITDYRKNGPTALYGDRIELWGRLTEPSPQRNPGGYDDRQYLKRQGIHARISVREADEVKKLGNESTLFGLTIVPLREHTWNVLHKLFPPGEAELAGGLVIGFKSDLPDSWQSAFEMLSVTHILAASGMNVGLIAAFLFYLMKRLRIAKPIANTAVIGTILIYTLLAGAGPSVVRAGLMATLLIVGISLGRNVDILTTIATAALLSSLWNPGIVTDIGFQLSFIVTLGLFLLTPRLISFIPGPKWLRTGLAVTIAAQISSAPILLYHFNQLSPVSLLANLYIMPLTYLLVPIGFGLLVLGSVHPWLAVPFVGFYRVLMWLLVKPVVWAADVTESWTWTIPSPPAWVVWLLYGCLLLGMQYRAAGSAVKRVLEFVRRTWRNRLLFPAAVVIVAALMIGIPALWPSAELRVTFLDVGQGDSTLIETPGGLSILVDGGGVPSYLESDFDTGDRIVLPFLRHRGIRSIDFMIATHADEDHVRGLLTVIDKIPVRNLIVSGYDDPGIAFQELLRKARNKGIPIYESKAGIGWELEPGLEWRFLHPGQIRTGTRSDSNANSVVFELAYGQRTFLFTGDVEGEAEPDLLPYIHPVDVLKVAHHGSHHSTTEAFLEQARPRYAVISAGKHNIFRHPHPEVLQRLAQAGATVFRTDRQGAITVTTDGRDLRITSHFKTS